MIDYNDYTSSGYAIAENLITGQSDPQLNYMWEVTIEGANRPYDYHNKAQLYAIDCNIPSRSVEVIERKYMGEPVSHTANKNSTNEVRCTFWDDRSLVGYRYFNQWFNMVSDPQFGRKAKDDRIKRKVTLMLKDRTDFFKGAKIDFTNATVTEIGEVSLSYDESAPMQFEITLRFEDMLINDTTYRQIQTLSGGALGDGDVLGGFF